MKIPQKVSDRLSETVSDNRLSVLRSVRGIETLGARSDSRSSDAERRGGDGAPVQERIIIISACVEGGRAGGREKEFCRLHTSSSVVSNLVAMQQIRACAGAGGRVQVAVLVHLLFCASAGTASDPERTCDFEEDVDYASGTQCAAPNPTDCRYMLATRGVRAHSCGGAVVGLCRPQGPAAGVAEDFQHQRGVLPGVHR